MSSKDDVDSILYSNLNWCDVTCGFTRKAMGVLLLIGNPCCWPGGRRSNALVFTTVEEVFVGDGATIATPSPKSRAARTLKDNGTATE